MWFAHGRNKTIAMSPRIRILNSVGVVDCWLLDTCDAIMYRASNTISRVLLKIFLSPPHCCGIVERGVSFLEGMSSPPGAGGGAGVRTIPWGGLPCTPGWRPSPIFPTQSRGLPDDGSWGTQSAVLDLLILFILLNNLRALASSVSSASRVHQQVAIVPRSLLSPLMKYQHAQIDW